MKSLVIGYGSIGSRHARILEELGCSVSVVSSRPVQVSPLFSNIEAAFRSEQPDYVVVASETSRHIKDLHMVLRCGHKGLILVEKPLFHEAPVEDHCPVANCFVAYNLRFHPLMARLRELLENELILTAQIYVGQYLPLWRPGRDYRQVYSASTQNGGGVLRDLSHELDLINWLFGNWNSLAAVGGHYSSLEISSDDSYALLMKMERCPVVSLQVNYLDRVGRRSLLINTDAHTIEVDFSTGYLAVDGQREPHPAERDQTYREMHRAFLNNDVVTACSYAEGMDVVEMIDAAERAAKEGVWITKQ